MEKWIEEFKEECNAMIELWKSNYAPFGEHWAYGALAALEKLSRALAKYENENCSITGTQPVPPAESLHEMAKRWMKAHEGKNAKLAMWELCGHLANGYGMELEKWASENPPAPVKTYRQDFFEKFPDAPKKGNKVPVPYVIEVYDVCEAKSCEYSETSTFDAWDKPLGYWES